MSLAMLKKIVGINARNLEYIFPENNRKYYPMVDNKLLTKEILQKHNLPSVPSLFKCTNSLEIYRLEKNIDAWESFVVKPARGFGGGGILVVTGRSGNNWHTASGKVITKKELLRHASEILFGVYSIDNTSDFLLVEELVYAPDVLKPVSYQGLPDIRVIVFRNKIIQSMLRLPTKKSDGKANLHIGGIGVGVDCETGITKRAFIKGKEVTHHPDTGAVLGGLQIPSWEKILEHSIALSEIFPLNYIGMDWVVNEKGDPVVLELNARPGIEIQNVNQRGLRPLLEGAKL